jgi:hypothetical protein
VLAETEVEVETELEVLVWVDVPVWVDEAPEEELDPVPPGARKTYPPATTIKITTTPRTI